MPPVLTVVLSDPERDALAHEVQRYGTYPDVAADLAVGVRTVEGWMQITNRKAIPERRLEDLLRLILRVRPHAADSLRWVLRDAARNCLQAAESAVERERVQERLRAAAGIAADGRLAVGPHEARARGHVGVVKAAGLT